MENITNLPKHIAIIMDGNGRWALERGLPRFQGHQKGIESIREITRTAVELKIPYVTFYAFSKENWARPKQEVEFLMGLLVQYLDLEFTDMKRLGIRFQILGRLEDLPDSAQEKIRTVVNDTRENSNLVMNLALSYSSRSEIVSAAKKISEEVREGVLTPDQIDEACFSRHLYTAGMPDPDLLIRTSGELRVSNFLLWQISYAEIYVTEKCWPDFRRGDFLEAIREYAKRERRFGRTESVRKVTA